MPASKSCTLTARAEPTPAKACTLRLEPISGLLTAYDAFGEREFYDLAVRNAEFLLENMYDQGKLLRSYKDGTSNIDAYLELRKGLDKSISNTMRYKKNTDIGLTNEEVARLLGEFSEAVMRGPSPLSAGLREMVAAFTSDRNHCVF